MEKSSVLGKYGYTLTVLTSEAFSEDPLDEEDAELERSLTPGFLWPVATFDVRPISRVMPQAVGWSFQRNHALFETALWPFRRHRLLKRTAGREAQGSDGNLPSPVAGWPCCHFADQQ